MVFFYCQPKYAEPLTFARSRLKGASWICNFVDINIEVMIDHQALGCNTPERRQQLFRLIRRGEVTCAGYKRARIYGTLRCRAGKRMKLENRVFFRDEQEAVERGYRPCGRCMPEKYKLWKAGVRVFE